MIDGAHRWPVEGGHCSVDIRGGRVADMFFEFSRLADPDSSGWERRYAKFNPAPIRVDIKAAVQNSMGLTTRAWIECEQLRISEVVQLIFTTSQSLAAAEHYIRTAAVAAAAAAPVAARFFDLRNMARNLRWAGETVDLSERDRDFCRWLEEVRVEPLTKPRSKFTGWGDPSDYSRPYGIVSGPSFEDDGGYGYPPQWKKWTTSS